jgi:heat shock 70kDa protein 4
MPSTKILTFYRKQPFDLEAKYAKPDNLPGRTNPWIGRFSVKGVKADGKDDFMICKLKARLNLHGVLNVEQGYYVEEQEVEEPVAEPKEEKKDSDVSTSLAERAVYVLSDDELVECIDISVDESSNAYPQERAAKRTKIGEKLTNATVQAMDTDEKANGEAKGPAPKTRKVKKQVRKGDLQLSVGTASLDQATKDAFAEKEGQMIAEDKLVADTEDKKNELESEIYSMRNKIDEPYESNGYADFANEDEKAKVKAKCEELEVSLNPLLETPNNFSNQNVTGLALRRRRRRNKRPIHRQNGRAALRRGTRDPALPRQAAARGRSAPEGCRGGRGEEARRGGGEEEGGRGEAESGG